MNAGYRREASRGTEKKPGRNVSPVLTCPDNACRLAGAMQVSKTTPALWKSRPTTLESLSVSHGHAISHPGQHSPHWWETMSGVDEIDLTRCVGSQILQ